MMKISRPFRFKQFEIRQDRCAMKVGTDGVLIGAWAEVSGARAVLDAGCGTGLISLMVAQRNGESRIDAVEIDQDAAEQAKENVKRSAWAERINVVNVDVRQWCETVQTRYDLVISNPPYFSNSLGCPDEGRLKARHDESLSLEELAAGVSRVMSADGRFCVILPYREAERMVMTCEVEGLYPNRQTDVYGRTDAEFPVRVMMEFVRSVTGESRRASLYIEKSRNVYTDEYTDLTKVFYLNM